MMAPATRAYSTTPTQPLYSARGQATSTGGATAPVRNRAFQAAVSRALSEQFARGIFRGFAVGVTLSGGQCFGFSSLTSPSFHHLFSQGEAIRDSGYD
jgi:hypothetical protein